MFMCSFSDSRSINEISCAKLNRNHEKISFVYFNAMWCDNINNWMQIQTSDSSNGLLFGLILRNILSTILNIHNFKYLCHRSKPFFLKSERTAFVTCLSRGHMSWRADPEEDRDTVATWGVSAAGWLTGDLHMTPHKGSTVLWEGNGLFCSLFSSDPVPDSISCFIRVLKCVWSLIKNIFSLIFAKRKTKLTSASRPCVVLLWK